MPKAKKAIVIGAGMAGVSAASKLAEEGWDVTVLERRLRIGGRINSHRCTCKACMVSHPCCAPALVSGPLIFLGVVYV